MQAFKDFIKYIPNQLFWLFTVSVARFYKKPKAESILLVPAGDLDGGFGEDIMITSFIANFSNNIPVTLLTYNIIKRDDYLINFPNLTYKGGFRDLNYLNLLKIVSNHTQIYVIGADIMDGTYGYMTTSLRLRILKLANILGLQCKFSGFSVSKKILPSIKEELSEVSQFTKIKARDIDSYDRLSSFISEKNLILTNDIAFICPDIPATYAGDEYEKYSEWCATQRLAGARIIGVCPNSIQANKIGLKKYIDDLKTLLNNFRLQGNFSFVFLYHDVRPLCGNDTDKTISQAIYHYFQANQFSSYFPDQITNGAALKGYLNPIDFTVTGRMHLGISGIVALKPMYGICYANKFEGMLKLFDIAPETSLTDYTAMTDSSNQIKIFLDNFQSITEKILHNLDSVKANTLCNGN